MVLKLFWLHGILIGNIDIDKTRKSGIGYFQTAQFDENELITWRQTTNHLISCTKALFTVNYQSFQLKMVA